MRIFPKVAAVVPPVRAVLTEKQDYWRASRRHYSAESLPKLDEPRHTILQPPPAES